MLRTLLARASIDAVGKAAMIAGGREWTYEEGLLHPGAVSTAQMEASLRLRRQHQLVTPS